MSIEYLVFYRLKFFLFTTYKKKATHHNPLWRMLHKGSCFEHIVFVPITIIIQHWNPSHLIQHPCFSNYLTWLHSNQPSWWEFFSLSLTHQTHMFLILMRPNTLFSLTIESHKSAQHHTFFITTNKHLCKNSTGEVKFGYSVFFLRSYLCVWLTVDCSKCEATLANLWPLPL